MYRISRICLRAEGLSQLLSDSVFCVTHAHRHVSQTFACLSLRGPSRQAYGSSLLSADAVIRRRASPLSVDGLLHSLHCGLEVQRLNVLLPKVQPRYQFLSSKTPSNWYNAPRLDS